MILKRDINLFKKSNDANLPSEAIFDNQEFCLEEPGIYSIEGPNQVGKSVLVKLLVGALPPSFDRELAVSATYVNDTPVQIKTVIDAVDNGMIAVFQDETLIPTMTVREQILMRHSNPKIRVISDQIIAFVWNDLILKHVVGKVSIVTPPGMKKLHYRCRELTSEEVESKLNDLLGKYGHPGIADRLPIELSGGQKAIVRLISAQLYEHINILFLDEVLANVDVDTRKTIVSTLRGWVEAESGRTIVIVTHSNEEKLLWRPKKEFVIRNGTIRASEVRNCVSVHLSLPKAQDTIPVFKYPYPNTIRLHKSFEGQSFIITSDTIKNTYGDSVSQVEDVLKSISGTMPKTIIIDGGEKSKDHEKLFPVIEIILQRIDSINRLGAVASIGGGATLNFGGFVTSVLFRGSSGYIVVPTNFTALSDVVIGSKTSINYRTENDDCFKNALGVYADPTAILLDHRFFEFIPADEKRRGLIECLKHGLLQNEDLFNRVYGLIISRNPDVGECIEVSETVMNYKSEILSRHPWEKKGGRILRYGHVFAHALERASKFQIPHSNAVLWGILVELRLAGHAEVVQKIEELITQTPELGHGDCAAIDVEEFVGELNKENYYGISPYPAIAVPRIGYYLFPGREDVDEVVVSVDEIKTAVHQVNRVLN